MDTAFAGPGASQLYRVLLTVDNPFGLFTLTFFFHSL